MPKRATRPRYHSSRGGWYCQINGKRLLLAKDETDGEEHYRRLRTWTKALVRFWEITKTDIKVIVKGVDWERLANTQRQYDPDGQFAKRYSKVRQFWEADEWVDTCWKTHMLTNEQIEKKLVEAGVTREMMAMFTPVPTPSA